MNKFILFFFLFLLVPTGMWAQHIITGKVIDLSSGEPLAYAKVSIVGTKNTTLTSIEGFFELNVSSGDKAFEVSYIGHKPQIIKLNGQNNFTIILEPNVEGLSNVLIKSTNLIAKKIVEKALIYKPLNDIDLKYGTYSFKGYNKLIIDNEKNAASVNIDTSKAEVKTIIEKGRSYLSEQYNHYYYTKSKGLKEVIEATRTAGFKKPVYEMFSIKVQSNSWYKEKYTIFGTDYIGPLSKNPFNKYAYEVLDTTETRRPAYVVYFYPKNEKVVAGLEGVMYIDTLNYGLQKVIGQLKGEVDVKVNQDYNYVSEEDIWVPSNSKLTLKPGVGGKKVSIFGGTLSFGSLTSNSGRKDRQEALFLQSVGNTFEYVFNQPIQKKELKSKITVLPNASEKSHAFWDEKRTLPFTDRDKATFVRVDSIIRKNNIDRKIDVIQHFNNGYFPISFFDIDLRTLVKYNNYEGLRLGLGGVTNEKLSNWFKLQSYGAYGFIDGNVKYGAGLSFLLSKKTGTWLNFSYADDIAEVASYNYLTDLLEYSLFEPRLVNINFYYKYQTRKVSLQHRFSPKIMSQWQLSKSDIQQTGAYEFTNHTQTYKKYNITEATLAVKWNPYSSFLTSEGKVIEVSKGYPKFTVQATQAFSGFLDGDFNYTKLGAKIDYTINRITQNNTEFLLEGNYAFGDLPLTHAFHAYPNSPQRQLIMRRFSVAGRHSFETMYFNEFFSDRLAALQVKHNFRPFDLGRKFKPELVLITRHAIGNMSEKNKHLGLGFNTLEKGYSESGIEINKLLFGFGLSFAYRYGPYHLPRFEDNIALKFTFYLKL